MNRRSFIAVGLAAVVLLLSGVSSANEFSCPAGFSITRGEVPHPWFDDVAVPSAWCAVASGVKHGPWWGWDPKTKTVLFKVNTVNGQPHGLYRMYYTNGQVAEQGSLTRGKRVGPWITYNPDGTVRSQERK